MCIQNFLNSYAFSKFFYFFMCESFHLIGFVTLTFTICQPLETQKMNRNEDEEGGRCGTANTKQVLLNCVCKKVLLEFRSVTVSVRKVRKASQRN